jgi:hypothetical protein
VLGEEIARQRAKGVDAVPEYGLQKGLSAAEVPVQGRGTDAGSSGDLLQ